MSTLVFWRAESTTPDATHDRFPVGTSITPFFTPSISTAAARQGTNGILSDSGGDQYRLDPANFMSASEGSMATWFRFTTWNNSSQLLYLRSNSSFTYNYTLSTTHISDGSVNDLKFIVNEEHATLKTTIKTTLGTLVANNWYFVTCSWHVANQLLRLRVYNSSKVLLQEVLRSGSFTPPDNVNGRIVTGNPGGLTSGQQHEDNIFMGSAYDDADKFIFNADITSYTEWTEPAQTVTAGGNTVAISVPDAFVGRTLEAGGNTATVYAPDALVGLTLDAGVNTIGVYVPDAVVGRTLAAGENTVGVAAPLVVPIPRICEAGGNEILVSAPTASFGPPVLRITRHPALLREVMPHAAKHAWRKDTSTVVSIR